MYNKEEIQQLQADYAEGTIIEFDSIDAKYGVETGTRVGVVGVNDKGMLFALQQNGKMLAIDYGTATFHKVGDVYTTDFEIEQFDTETKYVLLYGDCSDGTVLLNGVDAVAEFICKYGIHEDVKVYTVDGEELLSTFGIYLNKIADMNYREELVKVLIPMQQKIEAGCMQ